MSKGKVARVAVYERPDHSLGYREEPNYEDSSFDEMTPECDACGETHVGVATPVHMVIPGMLFPSTEYAGTPVFIPDPQVQMQILTMPNGQIGLVTDQTTTKHVHEDCYDRLVNEIINDEDEDEEDWT